jgi:hypothetical protein
MYVKFYIPILMHFCWYCPLNRSLMHRYAYFKDFSYKKLYNSSCHWPYGNLKAVDSFSLLLRSLQWTNKCTLLKELSFCLSSYPLISLHHSQSHDPPCLHSFTLSTSHTLTFYCANLEIPQTIHSIVLI